MNYTKIKFERIASPVGFVTFSREPDISGYKRKTQFFQPKSFSNGGDLYVYNKGLETKKFRTLFFSDISVDDLANFMYFFESIAFGSLNSFLFTDRDGTTLPAIIWNSDDIESTPQLANRESLTVELMIDSDLDEY
jgi:hypothetical protein